VSIAYLRRGRRIFSAVTDRATGRRILSAVTDRRYRRRRLQSDNPISFDSVPNRLGRLDRIYVRAPIYFLTACTAQRRPLLAKQDVHEAFIRFARQGPAHGVWIGAYVLMPDHLHAFVALDAERVNLSALMKSLKNVLSKKLRERGVAPPHWQKGFFDHLLRSQESAAEKWKYVRENPVRAGLVGYSSEWRYLGEIFTLDYRVERL